ncbi:MAG: choice-of-anchor R domain-containing protein, partial [Candidatus Thermoplasmatota archaeon]
MHRRALSIPALVLALLGSSLSVSPPTHAAQLGIHEFVDIPFVEGPFIFKNQDLAQSFTATTSYRLVRVDAMVHDLDLSQPFDTLNLTIQTDGAGVPSGTVLANGSADGDFGYRWVAFDLTPPVDLTAGQAYWIVLQNDENQQSGYKWATKSFDSYPGGLYAIRSGGGSWVRATSDDLLFRTWGLSGPNVSAGIEVDSPTAGVLDPLSYTIHLNNSGTERASFVWTNLTLSANQTYESDTAASAGGIPTGPTSWVFTDVGVGTHSFRVSARVRPGIFDGLRMDTAVTIEYANMTEGMQERTQATATVTARVPSITVAKAAVPRFLGPAESLTYTITIVNSGSRPSARVWVNDTLPPEVQYLGNTANTLANYTGEWWDSATLRVNLTSLPQGTFAFNITARVRPGLVNGTAFANVVYVDYTDNRGFAVSPNATASATARIHGASIQVAKSAAVDLAGPGQDVVYRIRYDNRGNAPARWAWINDTLPPEVEYVSDTGGGVLSGAVVRFAYANVSVGSHSLTLSVRVRNGTLDGTVARNVVDLAHTDSDGSPTPSSRAIADVLVVRPIIALSFTAPATA